MKSIFGYNILLKQEYVREIINIGLLLFAGKLFVNKHRVSKVSLACDYRCTYLIQIGSLLRDLNKWNQNGISCILYKSISIV